MLLSLCILSRVSCLKSESLFWKFAARMWPTIYEFRLVSLTFKFLFATMLASGSLATNIDFIACQIALRYDLYAFRCHSRSNWSARGEQTCRDTSLLALGYPIIRLLTKSNGLPWLATRLFLLTTRAG